ncbi:MAG: PLP-dependent aminotransferase family protein, partial [Dehalococcoidia bacterium]|nr:PLP-dependent aminotransferase family protein [Dehalococcoidia bacterium]
RVAGTGQQPPASGDIPVTVQRTLAQELADRWSQYDLDELASDAVKVVTAGTPTDWGLPSDVQSVVTPITLGGGIPDPQSLPREALTEAMARAVAVIDDTPLRYGGAYGFEPLREFLAERYTRDRGFPVTADYFLLTNGSAGAIDQVAATLISPGDVVISEAPTFSGSIRTFRGHMAEIATVPMDDDGMVVDELEPLLDRLTAMGKTVKVIYTISSFHNPMGVTLSAERREKLLRIAAERGIFIVDDDAYGDLWFQEPARPQSLSAMSECNGVITVGTFSKVVATGLRVGWIHTTPDLLDRVVRVRFEMGNSPLLHAMLYEFAKDGGLDRHINHVRKIYERKANTLASALREYCEPYLTFNKPNGGFFLWVDLAEGLAGGAVSRAAMEEGLIAPAGLSFFPDRKDTGDHIRLAYSWVQEDELVEAARRLARACERVANGTVR